MLPPLSSLKALAALRSSLSFSSSLALLGETPGAFFLLSSKPPQQGISTLLPRPQSHQHFGGGAGNVRIGNCIWKCSSGNFFWKRPGNLCPFSFPAKISGTPSRAPRRETYSRGSPFGLFPAREKTPPSGVRSFPLNQVLYRPRAVWRPPETERERVT